MIRLSPDTDRREEEPSSAQHRATQTGGRILGSRWQKSQRLKQQQDLALDFSSLYIRLISRFVCSEVGGTLLSNSTGGSDIQINS